MNLAAPRVRRLADGIKPDASLHIPLVIVGGGACGLIAAMRANELGVSTVVLEREAHSGGSTALSSGFIPACNSQTQRASGIEDSVALFVSDIQRKAHRQASPELALAFAQASGSALDWLSQIHGIPFEVLDGFLYPGHSVRRMHAVPEKTGQALMDHLYRASQRIAVDVLYDAHVDELIVDSETRIAAVSYQRPDGSRDTLSCDALFLACNGYGGNPDLIKRWLPEMRTATFAGHAGNDGSAVLWGQQLGAGLADMGGYQGHGSWAMPHGVLVSWALMTRGAVQINCHGERFHDESGGYSEAAVTVLAQPGACAYNVYDQALHDFASGFPDYLQAQQLGAIHPAASVAALSELIGCDEAVLSSTLNQMGAPHSDRFGRAFERSLSPPYYAVKVTGALFHTQGGLAINAQGCVLDNENRRLPNLFAAGGAARGVSGNTVDGYLSGNGLLSAVAGGYLFGACVAHEILERTQ